MTILIRRFRDWWQAPRQVSHRPEHRQVTFLELFYDLVYVAIIAELSHALSNHIGWEGLGGFAFLFVIVWWAWLNGTTYHDLHGQNDIRTRTFTFLQMLTVVAMAVFAHDALGESSVGFALSYAAFQLILTYLWWRTGVHDPDHRPLSIPYVVVFLITTVLFVGSVFISVPWRFYLWGLAVALSLALPIYTFVIGRRDPKVQEQIDIVTAISPSLVERFGLFSIIVLGEIVVGVVGGVTEHHHLNWLIGGTAALGTMAAFGLWWVYFDFVSHHPPLHTPGMVVSWFYLHLPLTIGIAAVGASVLNIVEHAGEHLHSEVRWLLVGATAVSLASSAVLTRTLQLNAEHQRTHRAGRWVIFLSAIVVAMLGFTSLEAIPLLVIVVALLMAPIIVVLFVWLRMLDSGEGSLPQV